MAGIGPGPSLVMQIKRYGDDYNVRWFELVR